MNNKLFWGYLLSGLISFINLLVVIFQDVSSLFWLLTPLLAPLVIACFVIKNSTVTQRDAIKSCNDTILFSVSVVTTAILTFKTIGLPHDDFFKVLMTNRIGYFLVCSYAILLTIKASIAFSESIEKVKKLYNKSTDPSQDKQ
ncbi:hypothetical protein [Rouxiella badensis]|uniref:hypothetical protein n=1 Tax=Rouxiella badensis TaxID=1646377 RepID=UPI003C67E13C